MTSPMRSWSRSPVEQPAFEPPSVIPAAGPAEGVGVTPAPRLILGIDPGTAITGYGVIEQQGNRFRPLEFGVIRTEAGEPLPVRLEEIFARVADLVARYRPQAAAVEALFFNANAQTAFAVGQARGVVLLACSQAGCDLFEYTPQQVKQAVVGYGKAEKRQVQEMVRVLLALDDVPRPDDAADALGIALCHGQTRGVRDRLAPLLAQQAQAGKTGAARRRRTP